MALKIDTDEASYGFLKVSGGETFIRVIDRDEDERDGITVCLPKEIAIRFAKEILKEYGEDDAKTS